MFQIHANQLPFVVRIALCSLLLCLIGCTPLSEESIEVSQLTTTALTVTVQTQDSIPAPQPRPDFVYQVSPLESETIPLSLFESPGDPSEDISLPSDGRPAGFPIPAQGYNSKVCTAINLAPLVQPKDDLTSYDKIMAHVTFSIDEHELGEPAFDYFRTDLEDEIIVAEDGLTQWIGLFTLCWTRELLAGAHQATFQFEQTSGDIQSYSWHFIIVDG